MRILRRLATTLRSWWEREDAAPRTPPVPGRPAPRPDGPPRPADRLTHAHPNEGAAG